MAHSFELYHYWRSSCSWRVRWALHHKKLAYKSHAVNLLTGEQRSPAYLQINPSGTVPTLVIDGVAHNESLALIEWIDETYPSQPLLPVPALEKLIVRKLAHTIASGVFPIQNLSVQNYVGAKGVDKLTFARHWIEKGFAVYEHMITRNNYAGTYSFGSSVTLADLCLVPQVYNALRFGVDMNPYPTIKGIYDRCLVLPECDNAAPANQPGAVK